MEMMGAIQELLKLMCAPIGKHLKHHRNLDKNMTLLHRKMQALNSRKEDMESRMTTELCSGKETKQEVKLWLQNVEIINGEVEVVIQEVSEGNFFSRARLGKLVGKKIQEVEELYHKGSFPDSLVVDAAPSIDIMPITTITGETTAKRTMEKVWAFLMDDNARKIGVYGMGGVGKTTIMKHIYNRLQTETTLFGQVVWVTVSKVATIFQLQNDIARKFGLFLEENQDETMRAAKLYSMLRARQGYLIILDDMWQEFYLEDVGIPEPTTDNKWKLVLTTRSSEICYKMKCKTTKVPLLSGVEAWNLFLEKVRNDNIASEIEIIAKEIARECGCLPLAIITMARSMKGVVDIAGWRNALEELRESTKGLKDMKKVYEQLKFSFNHLEDEGLQQCLLYCALYPEDLNIARKELIEHLIAEGLIEGRTREAELDKGHAMLNKLENACLLEGVTDNQNNRWVKMHDLIRDMALQMSGIRFLVKAGVFLRDFPSIEKWTENLARVSLMQNFLSEIPSSLSPSCYMLSTLLLSSTHLTEIPNTFFLHLCNLQVLDLSDTNIENLPNSLSSLENLTTLLLRGCTRLKYIPSLAKLVSLRKLDLNHTGIKEVPEGMEMLTKLKYLNLYAENLEMIPAGILPKLSNLQFLIVYGESETLKLKGEEVACLRKLETFAGQFYALNDLFLYMRRVHKQPPSSFFIRVGTSSVTDEEGMETFGKVLKLKNCFAGIDREEIPVPPVGAELTMEECHNPSSLIDLSYGIYSSPIKIRRALAVDCHEIEYTIQLSSFVPFEGLESLVSEHMKQFQAYIKGKAAAMTTGFFSALRTFNICGYHLITKLFSKSLLLHLPKLEELTVWCCYELEEIVATEAEVIGGKGSHSTHSEATILLPLLKRLSFRKLPKLRSIYTGVLSCCSLVEIQVSGCPNLKRIPLSLPQHNGETSTLQRISASKEWWEAWNGTNQKPKVLYNTVFSPCKLFVDS